MERRHVVKIINIVSYEVYILEIPIESWQNQLTPTDC